MIGHNRGDTSGADVEQLIADVERSTPDAVKRERAHTRHSIRAKVTVEPASMSARGSERIEGVTGDLSSGGTQLLTSKPLRIADLYLVTFDCEQVDVPPTYALCVRARLVRSDAFESGLKFLTHVDINTPKGSTGADPPATII